MYFFLLFGAFIAGDIIWWRNSDATLCRLPRPRLWRTLLGAFVGLQVGYMLFFLVLPTAARRSHAWMPTPVLALIYLWHLLILPLTGAGHGAASLLGFVWRLKKRLHSSPRPTARASQPSGPTRRQLLQTAAVAAPPLLACAGVGRALSQIQDFRIRAMTLDFPNLPPALDGLRIAQVSDIHVGKFSRGRLLKRIVDATNELRADLVLLTGDLIDLSLSDLPEGLDMVRKLDPRQGLVMIEGNHDLIESRGGFERAVKASGIPTLIDETLTIPVHGQPIQLLGVRWAGGGDEAQQSVRTIAKTLQPGAFPILLAHHPHCFDAAAAAGIPLTLSGHTHGGQLMLNERLGAGPTMFRYWSGLYQRGASQLMVSNGVGNWFPLRINARAEIVHITLRRQA
ncbi:MAG TPA: metallophosphoesterase [Tepidisphaeraceae bacterium]|jgi:predicted MPP superfamily phosphohydrolase